MNSALKNLIAGVFFPTGSVHGPEEQVSAQSLLALGYCLQDLNGKQITDIARNWYTPVWAYPKDSILKAPSPERS